MYFWKIFGNRREIYHISEHFLVLFELCVSVYCTVWLCGAALLLSVIVGIEHIKCIGWYLKTGRDGGKCQGITVLYGVFVLYRVHT